MAIVAPAQAMQPITDADLSQMTGQAGISIVADLKLNVGTLKYLDSTKSSSISLSNLSATGLMSTVVDVYPAAMYTMAMTDSLKVRGIADINVPSIITGINTTTGYVTGSDVLQLAFPQMPATAKGALLNVSVASISTGNSGASMGGLSITDINLGGSKIWIYGH